MRGEGEVGKVERAQLVRLDGVAVAVIDVDYPRADRRRPDNLGAVPGGAAPVVEQGGALGAPTRLHRGA